MPPLPAAMTGLRPGSTARILRRAHEGSQTIGFMTEAGENEHGFTIVRRSPPAGLEGLVVDSVGYREHGLLPIRQVEAASLVVPLIISFGEPFEIALGSDPASAEPYGSFTAGLSTRPALIGSAGSAHCLQVNLTPHGARRLLAIPMSDLAEQMVHIDDLGDRELAELRFRLAEAPDWDARFDIAEAFLHARLRRAAEPCARTAWAYDRILAADGRVSMSDLADAVGWSRKHLAQRFRSEIGLPPKSVARIARFARAQAMARETRDGWAGIAADCGYADQAHLVREFHDLSGETPASWRARAA